jgi:hypothetical protein
MSRHTINNSITTLCVGHPERGGEAYRYQRHQRQAGEGEIAIRITTSEEHKQNSGRATHFLQLLSDVTFLQLQTIDIGAGDEVRAPKMFASW